MFGAGFTFLPTGRAPGATLVATPVTYGTTWNGTTSATLTTSGARRMLVAISWRASDSTEPTVASGWTRVNGSTDGQIASVIAIREDATGALTATGTFTNSAVLVVHSFTNVNYSDPIGTVGKSFGHLTAEMDFPAITCEGKNRILQAAFLRNTGTNVETLKPSAYTTLYNNDTGSIETFHALSDGTHTSFSQINSNFAGAADKRWQSYVIELKGA